MLCRYRRLVVVAVFGGVIAAHGAVDTYHLWDGPIPLSWAEAPRENHEDPGRNGRGDAHVRDVKVPTLTVYTPTPEKNTGVCIILCPGGGYGLLALDREGHQIASRLQSEGITAAVLKYRLPRPGLVPDGHLIPLLDATQAVRRMRRDAASMGIKPDRIGILGFSAGGHLAASASNLYDEKLPVGQPDLSSISARPDFTVLIYPVVTFSAVGHAGSARNLLGPDAPEESKQAWSIEHRVNAQTPPAFLVHAEDDPVKIDNSRLYVAACETYRVPVQTYFFPKGGHGFGMGWPGTDSDQWIDRLKDFLGGLFPATPSTPAP